MFNFRNIRISTPVLSSVTAAILALLTACQPAPAPAECPPPPPQPKMEITPFKVPRSPDDDFCNACVRAQAGFVQCKREYESKRGEPRESLQKRAIESACKEVGYASGKCPDNSIIGVQCKNDPPNPGGMTAGQALQIISGRPGSPAAGSADSSKNAPSAPPAPPAGNSGVNKNADQKPPVIIE